MMAYDDWRLEFKGHPPVPGGAESKTEESPHDGPGIRLGVGSSGTRHCVAKRRPGDDSPHLGHGKIIMYATGPTGKLLRHPQYVSVVFVPAGMWPKFRHGVDIILPPQVVDGLGVFHRQLDNATGPPVVEWTI